MHRSSDTAASNRRSECVLTVEASAARASWSCIDAGVLISNGTLNETHHRVSRDLLPQWQDQEVNWERLNRIIVGVGPGSFSGIRAALATALGLARARRIPVSPMRSSDAIAIRHPQVSFLGVFSDARRGCFTFTAYQCGQRARPTSVHRMMELDDYLAKCSLAIGMDLLPGLPQYTMPDAQALYDSWIKWGTEEQLALAPIQLLPAVEAIAQDHTPPQTPQTLSR